MVFQFYSRAVLLSIISSIHHILVLDKATWRVLKNNGIARIITRLISTVTRNWKFIPDFCSKNNLFQAEYDFKSPFNSSITPSWNMQIQQIQQIVPSWEIRLSGQHARNVNSLIYIQPERQQPSSCSSDRFAVPKFLLRNICSYAELGQWWHWKLIWTTMILMCLKFISSQIYQTQWWIFPATISTGAIETGWERICATN